MFSRPKPGLSRSELSSKLSATCGYLAWLAGVLQTIKCRPLRSSPIFAALIGFPCPLSEFVRSRDQRFRSIPVQLGH
jgi:hypothetical protein